MNDAEFESNNYERHLLQRLHELLEKRTNDRKARQVEGLEVS